VKVLLEQNALFLIKTVKASASNNRCCTFKCFGYDNFAVVSRLVNVGEVTGFQELFEGDLATGDVSNTARVKVHSAIDVQLTLTIL